MISPGMRSCLIQTDYQKILSTLDSPLRRQILNHLNENNKKGTKVCELIEKLKNNFKEDDVQYELEQLQEESMIYPFNEYWHALN